MVGLSKSKIIAHRLCPKRLWLQVNQPDLVEFSDATEMNFQVGNKVGEIARSLHKGGVLIEGYDTKKALADTRQALEGEPRPVFEGAFQHDGVLIRADLLVPCEQAYTLVEVKSSTGVKAVHYEDTAIQTWVMKQTGMSIAKSCLGHIDTAFVYPGGGDYQGLLNYADISEEVDELLDDVPDWVAAAKKTLSGSEPEIEPGEQCYVPYECPFVGHCIEQEEVIDGVYSPMILPNRDGKKLGAELIAEGYSDLCDVSESRFSKPKHQRIVRACKSGRAVLDDEAKERLQALPYPRYYIDFESFNPAVPQWANSRPYQQITFQWSCHIEQKNGEIEHYEYLSEGQGDPRERFATSLVDILGTEGPVFVYSAVFEKSRIRELAEAYGALREQLEAINERVVDLLPIARSHYYHPAMRGSWSIKAVLPTVAPELAYDDLDVADGGMAMTAFAEMIDEKTASERAAQLRQALLLYCERDTLAMVKLAHFFEGRKEGA